MFTFWRCAWNESDSSDSTPCNIFAFLWIASNQKVSEEGGNGGGNKDTDGIPLPAITLLFANDASENQKYRFCYHLNVSIEDCLEKNTPNVSDILKKVLLGFEKKETLVLGEKEIIGDLAASRAGRIFTLRFPLKIGPNDDETQFFLFLAPTFVNVMLHDPNFFILNDNPYGLPTVTTVFDAATMFSHYHRIALSDIRVAKCHGYISLNEFAKARKMRKLRVRSVWKSLGWVGFWSKKCWPKIFPSIF